MSTGFSHSGGRVPPVAAGPCSLEVLADPTGVFGCHRAVLVVDQAVVTTGYTDRVTAVLGHLDPVELHVLPPKEPSASSVDAAAAVVRRAGSDVAVVGIGGGSTLDTAKLAAAVAADVHDVEYYGLGAHPLPAGCPLIAIPTTAGTGSEVTRTCVLTDRHGRKVWAWGDELLPDRVVLDPAAVATMPAHVAAASGLDAFVHATEAVTGRRTNPIVAAPALHAIRLVLGHLPAAVSGDVDARLVMQEAALLAGLAIDGGGTGIAHSIGHALGTLAAVPHGVAVAVGLAAALPWNVEGVPDAFAPVAAAIGRTVAELPDAYGELLAGAGFADAARRAGALEVTAPELAVAMVADENVPMYLNNCRVAGDEERLQLAASTLRMWDELLATAGR